MREQIAKDRKKSHVAYEFRTVFGLNLIDGHATTFANYGQTGELFRDFLDYSVSGKDLTEANARETLASSLSPFEERVRKDHLLLHTLPPRGAFRHHSENAKPFWTIVGETDFSMSGFYDRARTLTDTQEYRALPETLSAAVNKHIKLLERALILRFDSVLLCEGHLRACLTLCDLARRCHDPAPETVRAFGRALDLMSTNLKRASEM